jgi:hypothetical protein
MRLFEFADAEAQLALLRTIIDNTWTAVSQQAEQKRQSDAQRSAQAKLKPRGKSSRKGTGARIPNPPAPPAKLPQATAAKQPPLSAAKPTPIGLSGAKPQPLPNPQLKPQPASTVISPKLASNPYATPIASTAVKPLNGAKTGYFNKAAGATEKDDDTADRYSKNGIASLKK